MRAVIVVVLVACSAPAAQPLPPPTRVQSPDAVPFGPDDRVAELAALRDALRDNYAHLETKQQQWGFTLDGLYARYEPLIRKATTWTGFEAVMVEFVAELHDGHLQWRRKRAGTEVKRRLVWIGVDTRFAGDELIVTQVTPDGSAARAGLQPGDKLIAIDDETVEHRLSALSKIRSWSRIEAARYDFAGSWRSSRVAEGDKPKARRLTREAASGTRDTVVVVPEEPVRKNPGVSRAAVATSRAAVATSRAAIDLAWRGDVAVLRVRTLRGRVADTTKRADDFAAAMVAQPKGMVIDLRDNDGGYEDGARAIVAALTARTIAGGTTRVRLSRAARAAHKQWRELAEDPAKPGWSSAQPIVVTGHAPREYPAKIAVVIDAGCRSSCETLALLLHTMGARLVGEDTGGSGGAPITITLPKSAARVEIPARAAFDLAGKPIEGYGVAPDDLVAPTRADLTAGRDTALERAVAHVCTHANCP